MDCDSPEMHNVMLQELNLKQTSDADVVDEGWLVVSDEIEQPAAQDITDLLTNVVAATGYRYGCTDSIGQSIDCLRVVYSSISGISRYLGVYHTYNASLKTFNVHLAQSFDLLEWEFLTTLFTNADMPDIAIGPTGKVLIVHEQWMNPQSQSPCRIMFRLYDSVSTFIAGRVLISFLAPSTLSNLEGTPNVYTWSGSIDSVQIGFHYNDPTTQRDMVARGALTNFASWTASPDSTYNAIFTAAGATGNIGGRCYLPYEGSRFNIQEGNIQPPPIIPTNFKDWRVWLYSYQDNSAKILNVRTHKGSTSFGNPFGTIIPSPKDGRACLCVSYFLFGEGAADGESGSLIFYTPIE